MTLRSGRSSVDRTVTATPAAAMRFASARRSASGMVESLHMCPTATCPPSWYFSVRSHTRWMSIASGELPVLHLAEPVAGLFRILDGGSGTATGCLHIGLDHVKLAVAEFGHGMNIGIAVHADAG